MQDLLKLLADSQRTVQIANDQKGKALYPTLGVVTANNDPDGKRRIKVALPHSPQVESYWFRKLVINKDSDCAVPDVGQTVFIFFADGIETDGYYLQIYNDTNPTKDKNDPLNDHVEGIKGERNITVSKKNTLTVDDDSELNVSGDITNNGEGEFKVEVNKNILMKALQALTLNAAQYVLLQAGTWFVKLYSNGTSEMGGGVLTVNCGGHGINFTNVGTMMINGKSVATLGATDSDGDSLITKGW